MFVDSGSERSNSLACIRRTTIVKFNMISSTFLYGRGFVNFDINKDVFEGVVSVEVGSNITLFKGVGGLRIVGRDEVYFSELADFIGATVKKPSEIYRVP